MPQEVPRRRPLTQLRAHAELETLPPPPQTHKHTPMAGHQPTCLPHSRSQSSRKRGEGGGGRAEPEQQCLMRESVVPRSESKAGSGLEQRVCRMGSAPLHPAPTPPRPAMVSTPHFPSSPELLGSSPPSVSHTNTHTHILTHASTHTNAVTGQTQVVTAPLKPSTAPQCLQGTALWLPLEAWVSGPCFPDLFFPIFLLPKFFLPGTTFPLTYMPPTPDSVVPSFTACQTHPGCSLKMCLPRSHLELASVILGPRVENLRSHLSCTCHTMGNIVI